MFELLSEIDWLWQEPAPLIATVTGVVCFLIVLTAAVLAFAKSLKKGT